ncbi:MAG: nucleoside recognition domain-containing protein [Deinococcales bacterium]
MTPIFEPMGITPDNWPAVSGLIAGATAKEVVIGTFNGIYQRQAGSSRMATFVHPAVGSKLRDALRTVPANAAAFVSSLGDPLGLSSVRSLASAERASGADGATLGALAKGFTPLSALSYLVFVLLYVPCASTIGALRREVGWGWTTFSVLYGIGVAWGAATVLYQAGTFGHHPGTSALWIGGVILGVLAFVTGLRWYGLRSPGAAEAREAYS